MSAPEQRLADAGHVLPPPPQPRGSYAPFHLQTAAPDGGRPLSLSGQTCRVQGVALQGLCTADGPLEPARAAAQVAMLNLLAAVAAACGGHLPVQLEVTRLRGYVRAESGFTRHSRVLDAASDVLLIAWPGQPLPARTVVGVGSLPDGAFVEIEMDAVLR